MRVSIVTISFNQAQFLEAAITSVLEQKDAEIEYIVVDPGSTDGSRAIIERYRSQIDTVILDPDDGPADGLNRGLAAATGEVFAYVNADDALVPGAVAQAVRAFEQDPELAVVYGNGWVIDEAGRRGRRLISSRTVSARLYARRQVMIVQQASFMRTAWLRKVGGFNVANTTSWDGEAFLDIAQAGGRFRRVWADWGLFRLYGGSISGSGRLTERYERDCDRLFAQVYGRPKRRRDRVAEPVVRAIRQVVDPRGLASKLVDRMVGSTRGAQQ